MVPSQKDVLADYLSDMFGTPSAAAQKSEPEPSIADKRVSEKKVESEATLRQPKVNNAELDQKTSAGFNHAEDHLDASISLRGSSPDSGSKLLEPRRAGLGQKDGAPVQVKTKEENVLSPLAISAEGLDIEWSPELSSELDKISYQIDRDKQLSCLVDLVHQPIDHLSKGDMSLAMLELLALLKQLPESKLKELLRAQYDKVEQAKQNKRVDDVSV